MNNEVLDSIDFRQEAKAEQEENCMRNIVLKRIEITNFKGVAHRIEEFNEGENWITGANGTGKTTVFDAFVWLLFGKDSHGQSEEKAKIKMLDSNGHPLMQTDNSVEAVFDVNGEELVLKRTYKEKWRKPTGQSEKVYDGQKTEFSWNGNEKISATEYKKRVSELIDEGLFKLITDPLYFASLDVKERRSIILAMAGKVSDDTIRSHNEELTGFDPSKDVEEKRNVALSTKNRLVKDRDNYPARIDEQMQFITRKEQELSELSLSEKETLLAQKQEVKKKIVEIDEKLLDVSNRVGDIVSKNNERIILQREAEQYRRDKQHEADMKREKVNQDNQIVQREISMLKSDIASIEYKLSKNTDNLDATKATLKEFTDKIEVLRKEPVPNFDVESVCPTCKRPFEQAEIESKNEEMRESWILNQKKQIESIKGLGNTQFEKAKVLKSEIDELIKEKEEKEHLLDSKKALLKKPIPYKEVDLSADEEYLSIINSIPDEISIDEEIHAQSRVLKEERAELSVKGFEIDLALRKFEKEDIINRDITNAKERIEQLKKEELEVNQGIANQEKIIYLCDLWTKTKVNLLNDVISSNFNLVKFKMFNYTKEGNAVPTCEIVVDGVDYSALNTASKMNAGLDIINALINYYNVKAPIFIDNRESVTEIVAPNTQIINLAVKEGEK